MKDIYIHIVDDDPAMLTSICYFLASEGYESKCYRSASEFLENFWPFEGGCIVLDVKMPEVSGLELFEEILKRRIDLPIIFFSGHGDLPMAVNALRKGAFHFLEKPLRPEVFLEAIKSALVEDQRRRSGLLPIDQLKDEFNNLTEREIQVISLIRKGLTNKIIAERKGLSERTIENYRANIYKKLKVHDVDELKMALDLIEAKKV